MESYQKNMCAVCGKPFVDGDTIKPCLTCGKEYHLNCWITNNGCITAGCAENKSADQNNSISGRRCQNCNTPLSESHVFCPNCGAACIPPQNHSAGVAYASTTTTPAVAPVTYPPPKKKGKGAIIITVSVITVVLLSLIGIALFFLLDGTPVEKITFKEESIELKVGDTHKISYEVKPAKADTDNAEWESSDEDVAEVDERGEITANGKGSCEITITIGKEKESITITVKDKIDFEQIYLSLCSPTWAECGSDGTYLSVDTNPKDVDEEDMGYSEYQTFLAADEAIEKINEELGLPSSIYEEMSSTNALDGRQTRDFEDIGITVTWKYHPDNGLEVIYRLMN